MPVAITLGCGGAEPPTVTRRMDGERVVGNFVSPFSYEWFIRAELAEAQGDLEAAAEAYRMARAGPEDDALVLARLADVLDRLEHHTEADNILAEGLELDPESEAIWLATGRIAERRGEAERALEAYARAEASAPESEQAPLALARLLSREGAEGRAERVLSRFAGRGPPRSPAVLRARLELALARGDADAAAQVVRTLLDVAPARAQDVRRAAEATLEAGQPALAARLMEAVPATRENVALRVRALVAAGRPERAEAALATARDEDVGGPLERARLYLDAGRPDRANDIAASVAAGPNREPRAWLVAGEALLAQGRAAEAAVVLARVPRGVHGFARARVALAEALTSEGLEATAREVLAHALGGVVDDEPIARAALAELRARAGDFDGALALFEDDSTPSGVLLRARLFERAGREAEAQRTWRSLQPDDARLPIDVRARVRAERLAADGEPARAVRALRRAVRFAPQDLTHRARLAELLMRAGQAEEARRVANEALEQAVDPSLRERLAAIASGRT